MHGRAREGRRERRQALIRRLQDRGVFSPGKLMRHADLDAVDGAIRWWDDQRKRNPRVSAGVLTNAIKDGDLAWYGEPAEPGEPCPLLGSDRDRLAAAWTALDHRLTGEMGDVWRLWGRGVHLHGVGGEFVVACPPAAYPWIAERYSQLIARAAVVPVRFVACEGGQ